MVQAIWLLENLLAQHTMVKIHLVLPYRSRMHQFTWILIGKTAKTHHWVETILGSVKYISYASALRHFPLISFLLRLCIPLSVSKAQKNHIAFAEAKMEK